MKKNILKNIDPIRLGRDLQKARTRRGLTQADAAKVINTARTTLTAIEKGTRRIKPEELIELVRAYGRSVSEFVRERPRIEPFQVQFRGPHAYSRPEKEEIDKSIHKLEDLSRNYVELEEISQTPLSQNYPIEYKIDGIPVSHAADGVASQERNRMGLGDGPIPNLREILEQEVGLRIFYLPLRPSKFSAIYLFDHQAGGCIALNILHPEERRRWSLAHEYAHFLVHRHQPRMFIDGKFKRTLEKERFADCFALSFLMPTESLTRRFNNSRKETGKISAADLCNLAHYYGVSLSSMTHRLEDMRLLPTGTWDKLKEQGFKVREAQNQLGLPPMTSHDDMLPVRYKYLAIDAFDRGRLSEGRLAKFLDVDRIEARLIAQTLREHGSDVTEDDNIHIDLAQPVHAMGSV